MLWVAPGADPDRAFGSTPAECLKPVGDAALSLSVETGRAALRTPVVLGGQAARAGIACETCHRSGHTNPDFLFSGVSGPPGTADVTNSLFSTHRGNGQDDPRPIPNLSGPKSDLRVSQTQPGALEGFIRGLITEEFDGPEPTPAVLRGLADYVRALDPAACPAMARRPVDVALLMDDARRAVRAAQAQAAAGDRQTAVVLLAGARARLGLIDERFDAPGLGAQRLALRAADARLLSAQDALRTGDRRIDRDLTVWLTVSQALERRLDAAAAKSLFDPARLAQATKRAAS